MGDAVLTPFRQQSPSPRTHGEVPAAPGDGSSQISLSAQLLGGQHSELSHRPIPYDNNRRTRFDIRASAANHPVPMTSESAIKLGMNVSGGFSA